MPDGEYVLGGQTVILRDGRACLVDGTIAGGAKNLFQNMESTIRFGIRPEEAVLAATLTPARELGMDAEIGSLAPGKKADFLVCDENWDLQRVYLDGRRILCGDYSLHICRDRIEIQAASREGRRKYFSLDEEGVTNGKKSAYRRRYGNDQHGDHEETGEGRLGGVSTQPGKQEQGTAGGREGYTG